MLREFTARILDFQPDSWTTHVSGHPPGATLVFVWLDRIGLGGGALGRRRLRAASAAWSRWRCRSRCRALGAGPRRPARCCRSLVLFPGAVWVGASADGLFAGVTAIGIALLALSRAVPTARYAARAGRPGCCSASAIFLSYGLVLLGLVALAVALLGRRDCAACSGARRGAGRGRACSRWPASGGWTATTWSSSATTRASRSDRPYAYWVWANLACLALAAGPALAAGLRRTARSSGQRWAGHRSGAAARRWPRCSSSLFADLSGLSKAEIERIWLPFAVWLLPAAALLPRARRRWWLAAQAATALAVNHLVLTRW